MIKEFVTKLALLAFLGGFLSLSSYADLTADGVKIFKANKCQNCHSLLAHKIEIEEDPDEPKEEAKKGEEEREPPDLSGVGKERNARWIRAYLKKKAKIDGRKHSKSFKGSTKKAKKKELKVLAEFLEAQKTKVDVPKKKK